MNTILLHSFYARDTVTVARDVLGKVLMRTYNDTLLAGIITETEAYRYTDDPASHAYKGMTNRTVPLFGSVGRSYVYFIYGNHFCLNIVAKSDEQLAGAVLIRAVKPLYGTEQMIINRRGVQEKYLTNGPGKLTQAFGITMQDNCSDMTQYGSLYITQGFPVDPSAIYATKRIGISAGQDLLWRFVYDSYC